MTVIKTKTCILTFVALFGITFIYQHAGAFEINTKVSTEYNKKLEMDTGRDFDTIKKEIKDAAKKIKTGIKHEVTKILQPGTILPKEPTIDERKNTYVEIDDKLNLSMTQKIKFYNIMKDEKKILEPMALDLNSKQIRLSELDKIKCDGFDFKCKKTKKCNIEAIESEIDESKRQIRIKKEYYMILYKNVLTRNQGLILDEIIHDKALGNYINN